MKVVRIKNFLGVVAEDEWTCVRAMRALKAQWSDAQALPEQADLVTSLRAGPFVGDETIVKKGDAPPAPAAPDAIALKATYYWPIHTHGSIGPSCAIADVKADSATIWTASQGTHGNHDSFARFLGLPRDKVRMIYLDGAGCYGMNGHEDAAADAAIMSRAVGRPVRVQWMREDEHGWDPKGPPQLLDFAATVDAEGRIVQLAHRHVAAAGDAAACRSFRCSVRPKPGSTSRRASAPACSRRTAIRPMRAEQHERGRALAQGHAAAAGADPLAGQARQLLRGRELRRRACGRGEAWTRSPCACKGVSDPRGIEVHQAAGGADEMGEPPVAGHRTAPARWRAAAASPTSTTSTRRAYVAMGMEVAVERATGRIHVERVVCAHDCGQIINPDGVRAQVEGNILQTLSRVLMEEVKFDRSRVTSVDWASYPIMRFSEVPKLEIELIDRPTEPPLGAGEAASAPVGAALGNAVFDATGVRLRELPFTPERVKAALAGRST